MGYMFWVFVIGFGIVYAVVMLVIWQKKQTKTNEYLQQHPNAASIYVPFKYHIITERIKIFTINGEEAHHGKLENVYYAAPGRDVKLSVQWSYHRPGIFYKTVTKYTEIADILVDIAPETAYTLNYDRKEDRFIFKEK